jgi:glycosyltransferase involved in cell wall biosynthesis
MTIRTPRINVVLSPFQNAFFKELADVLVAELDALDTDHRLLTEPHEITPDERDVFVLLPPHEWVTVEGDAWLHDDRLTGRTIGIGAEQPGSPFFERNATIGRQLGLLYDFSARAVTAFRADGVQADHLPFGYTALWDRFAPDGNADGPEVLFMGNFKARRLDALARMAPTLGRHRTHLVLGDNTAPNTASSRWFVAGEDKRRLLASTKVLLNIHQANEPYFEWLRYTEAALAGAVMLTEPSTHSEPYRAGEHFVEAPLSLLPEALDDLLDDDTTWRRIRRDAYEAVRSHPFRDGVSALVESAAALTSRPVPTSLPPRTRSAAFAHSHDIAPPAPARARATTYSPLPTELIVVGAVEVSAPTATNAGPVSITHVTDRTAALAAIRASTAEAVGVIYRPVEVTPDGLELLQQLLQAGNDVACGMVAEPTSNDPLSARRLTGLWQPNSNGFDPFRWTDGWCLVRPSTVAGADRHIEAQQGVAHLPMPVVVSSAPPPPLVVVVMATFNPNVTLFHRQVQSLRAQHLTDFVCIVSDDGSEPATRTAMRRLLATDRRFELVEHDERVGFYGNFERGLDIARRRNPEFIALADQDDRWYPDKLARAVDTLRARGTSLVFTDVVPVDADLRVLSTSFFAERHPTTDSVLDLTMMNSAIGATCVFRTELLQVALPFPTPGYRSFHDHWLARCAQLAGGISFDPTPSMEYVQHTGNVQGFTATRPRLAAFTALLAAHRAGTPADATDDIALVRRRLDELRILEDRIGRSDALSASIRFHERCLRGGRAVTATLIGAWLRDQRVRRRPRHESIEIRYVRAALGADSHTTRGDHGT